MTRFRAARRPIIRYTRASKVRAAIAVDGREKGEEGEKERERKSVKGLCVVAFVYGCVERI